MTVQNWLATVRMTILWDCPCGVKLMLAMGESGEYTCGACGRRWHLRPTLTIHYDDPPAPAQEGPTLWHESEVPA